jgi:hypothetical protein
LQQIVRDFLLIDFRRKLIGTSIITIAVERGFGGVLNYEPGPGFFARRAAIWRPTITSQPESFNCWRGRSRAPYPITAIFLALRPRSASLS